MNKDEQLIDSLLKEHAKSKGVDEQFLTEVETKIDAAESGNVIDLNRDQPSNHANWKKGVGIGVAACAAFYVAGTMMWNTGDSAQELAINSGSANEQINSAMRSVGEIDSVIGADLADELAEKSSRNGQVEVQSMAENSVKSQEGLSAKDSVNLMKNKGNAAQKEKLHRDSNFGLSSVPAPSSAPANKKRPTIAKLEFGNSDPFGDGFAKSHGADVASIGGYSKSKKSRLRSDSLLDHELGSNVTGRKMRILEEASAVKYGNLIENSFTSPSDDESRRSTFAIDVDTASYANMRKMIQNGRTVPANSVRIEEMVNYFDYQYAKPGENAEHPFAVQVDSVSCPWNAKNKLVRVALQGKEIIRDDRPASNLVFLLDVSGSMNNQDKLPLLKQSLKYLLEEMDERDSVSMVVYAGASGLVLPSTKADAEGRVKILKAMDNLSSGGSTAGGAGIKLAYKIAQKNFIKDGVNRVVLATDGDFNVGVSGTTALTELVKAKALKGVDISVLGFGSGNLNDDMLESITNNGNGNYSYIDTIKEGRKVLLEDMTGTLVTIARDVKIQVEFNPEQVKEYRLVGYANRKLPNSAFLDKTADAGEVGAGHSVTAFYEVVPGKALDKAKLNELRYAKLTDLGDDSVEKVKDESNVQHADELLFVKLAYKQPHEKINDESTYLNVPLMVNDKDWKQADADFKFASSVALFGMVLRDSGNIGEGNLEMVQQLAEAGKGPDGKGYREEFINLVKKVKIKE